MALYTDADARKLVLRDPRLLAPGMRERAAAFSRACAQAGQPIRVWETARTHELARVYYALKRSQSPDGWHTWHFFGLAIDVIHPVRMWEPWEANDAASKLWRETVVRCGLAAGLKWGGHWTTFKDWPHFYFNTLRASPSDKSRELYMNGGIWELWRYVGALGSTPGTEVATPLEASVVPTPKLTATSLAIGVGLGPFAASLLNRLR